MGVLAKPIPFGDYFLLEKINTGGMAEVFKAKTFGVEGFERIVAVKKILPNIAEDKGFISMFIDEAKISGDLTHENIAHIFDLGNINGEYYIAMEYVSGHDLRVIYDRCVRTGQKLSIGCICYIISKICEGLDYAHNKKDANGQPMNIIHRDISPQNILVGYDGGCKLIDFGIAKATTQSSATQVGMLKGKISYMSPEQLAGKPNIDRRCDIFALGIVLFELLTLKRLFLGSNDFETLEKIRKVEVSPPTLYNSDIPEELEDIVLKALEKDNTMRYQTAAELQEALQRFMFKQNIYFTAKDLREFMQTMFAKEIANEQKKQELYKGMTKSVLTNSLKPEEKTEDETSFYNRTNAARLSGAQRDAVVANQPAPKQAIYDELDDFQPPSENIVYSQRSAASGDTEPKKKMPDDIRSIVTSSVTAGKPQAVARKSNFVQPVVVNKGHETLLTEPVKKEKSSNNTLIAVVVSLIVLILILLTVAFVLKFGPQSKNGQLTFKVYPEDVRFSLQINDNTAKNDLIETANVTDIATNTNTKYRVSAPGYETVEGIAVADEDGETIEIKLNPLQQGLLIRAYVATELATVTINGQKVEGERNFEIVPDAPGDYIIKVSKDGYKTEEQKITIDDDHNQKSVTFELKPAVAALVIKTHPYEARFKLTNNRTGEFTQGKATPSGFRIPDLPIDDTYTIVIYDGNDTLETTWQPQVLSLPNENQTRVFPTHDPNAAPAKVADSAPAAKSAETTAQAKSEDKAAQKTSDSSSKSSTRKDSASSTKSSTKTASAPKQAPAEEPKKADPAPAAPANNTPGILMVNSKPPAHVIIKGKDYGNTPVKIELPPGTYTLNFVNQEQNINSTQTITLKPGEVNKVLRK